MQHKLNQWLQLLQLPQLHQSNHNQKLFNADQIMFMIIMFKTVFAQHPYHLMMEKNVYHVIYLNIGIMI